MSGSGFFKGLERKGGQAGCLWRAMLVCRVWLRAYADPFLSLVIPQTGAWRCKAPIYGPYHRQGDRGPVQRAYRKPPAYPLAAPTALLLGHPGPF